MKLTIGQLLVRLEDGLTQREALGVAGISADTFATWLRRGRLPRELFDGNARVSPETAILLAMQARLVEAGVPVCEALALAPHFRTWALMNSGSERTVEQQRDEFIAHPRPLIVALGQSTPAIEAEGAWCSAHFVCLPADLARVRKLMQKHRSTRVLLLDVARWTVEILGWLESVRECRERRVNQTLAEKE